MVNIPLDILAASASADLFARRFAGLNQSLEFRDADDPVRVQPMEQRF